MSATGERPGAVLVNVATIDTFAHGWHLARATGRSTDLDPELAAALPEFARAFLPDAPRGSGGSVPFGAQVEAPPGAGAADELAAFLGPQV